MVFAAAFVVSSSAVFALAFWLGASLPVADVSLGGRRIITAIGLLFLALTDLLAIKIRTYCPLGWRRQTPKVVMYKYPPVVTVGIWGLDTGLAVTTFRVAAITWGAFMLTFLGLSGWQIGLGYGVGFVLPLITVILTHLNRDMDWLFLERLLKQRPVAQFGSAVLLTTGGLILLLQPVV
jgi:hypothetical protein